MNLYLSKNQLTMLIALDGTECLTTYELKHAIANYFERSSISAYECIKSMQILDTDTLQYIIDCYNSTDYRNCSNLHIHEYTPIICDGSIKQSTHTGIFSKID